MIDFRKQLEKLKKSGKAENKTAEYVKFEQPGQVIAGILVGKHAIQSTLNEGSYNQYIFDNGEQLVKFSLGTAADKECDAILVEGGAYAIEFVGNEKITGGRTVNKYKFYVVDLIEFQGGDKKSDENDTN
jgi:hypothetical protein